jgi:hypothetical protein
MKARQIGFALAVALAAHGVASARVPQRRAGGAATATAARSVGVDVRTVKGNMRGNVIAVRSLADRPLFDYVLTEARLVNGKLELAGSVRSSGRQAAGAGTLSATLVGSLAKEVSPEYTAARARRNAARSGAVRPGSGEQAKQQAGGPATTSENAAELGQLSQSTQSTARTTPAPAGAEGEKPKEARKAAATGIGGCEVVFLKLDLPARYVSVVGGRTVQLNVSLAQTDNRSGVDLNQRICRIVNALESGEDSADGELAELNRMLAGAK